MKREDLTRHYRQHGPLVLRRARQLLRDEQQAYDVMQDVFVKLIDRPAQLKGVDSPASWFYRVTTNLCFNRMRDRKRRQELLAQNAPESETSPAKDAGRVEVLGLLDQLPTKLCEVGLYYYVDEMSQEEIAELLGVTRRMVRYRLQQFRKKAQKILGHEPTNRAEQERS